MPSRRFVHSAAHEQERAAAEFQVDECERDPLCANCPSLIPRGWPTDLQPLWLHAHSYSCAEWTFSSPLPAWVADFATTLSENKLEP